jgi:tetratricopeptide (TPR) repeat protein
MVAESLVPALGRENILYDEYLAAELARPDLDLYLGTLYREQTDLIVPFLCADYQWKKWCNMEWRQIRDLWFQLEGERIMPFRFDDAPIPGMLSIDGYLMIGDREPKEVAELILHRLIISKGQPHLQGGQSKDINAAAYPSLVMWNVPYSRNPFFTGREDTLLTVRTRLEVSGRAALTQALSGMGGIGKTQTAIEYAYRYRDQYRAVMWVSSDTDITTKTSLVAIASGLGLVSKDDPDHNRALEAVKRWCDTNSRWLLVFDNADHPQLVKPFLPSSPRGHILLTSRAHVLDSVGVAKPLDVLEMPSQDAIDFLFARTGRIASPEEKEAAVALAKELGHLPLALEQAAAFIAAHDTLFKDYVASYRRRRLELLNETRPVAGDYPASVETTWAMNFAEMARADQVAAEVLRVSAFLAPESIPVEIFIDGASELGGQIATFVAKAGGDPLIGDRLLEPLTRYSLIRRDVASLTYTIHRLVQAVVRRSLDDDSRRQWALHATRALDKIFPSGSYDTWHQCDRLVAHGVAVAALVAEFGFGAADAGNVVNGVACYLRMRGDYGEAERIHRQSVALRERDSGPDDPEVATCLNNLALVYIDRFDFGRAEPLLVRSLQIMQRAAGHGGEDTSLALNNLGMCYVRSGKYFEAQPLLEQALAYEQGLSERQDFFYATILNNIAELQLGLGNNDEALRLCQEALELREKIGNPEKLGRSYITMATVLARQGEGARAEEFFKKALGNRESVYGLEHPELILTLRRYSDWLKSQGHADESAMMESRIADVCRRYEIPISRT